MEDEVMRDVLWKVCCGRCVVEGVLWKVCCGRCVAEDGDERCDVEDEVLWKMCCGRCVVEGVLWMVMRDVMWKEESEREMGTTINQTDNKRQKEGQEEDGDKL